MSRTTRKETAQAQALLPLWRFATGVVIASTLSQYVSVPGATALHWCLIGLGLTTAALALTRDPAGAVLLVFAGLAIAGGSGLAARSHHLHTLDVLSNHEDAAVRIRADIQSGWTTTRWGQQCRVRISDTRHREIQLNLPRICILEVRTKGTAYSLPPPGTTITCLARVHAAWKRPKLVVSSPQLLETLESAHGVNHVRNRLAEKLLIAAGTNVRRIRTAEFAAALALGRRDLVPFERRNRWRISGFAHLLAVSGLHVGIIFAALWFALIIFGAKPTHARIVILVTLPIYAALAGAAPSCVRASIMAMVYLGARLLGRQILPMGAVLLAATMMLVIDPSLVFDPGFQLTVGITAALIRWAPVLTKRIRGPVWLGALIAVPVVAQLSSGPIVAWHFRTLIPGAFLANLFVPLLLTPILLCAISATIIAQISGFSAGILLDILAWGRDLLWVCGTPGRLAEIITPQPPFSSAIVITIIGYWALSPSRRAHVGAIFWVLSIGVACFVWMNQTTPATTKVTMLPVSEGLATVITSGDNNILVDAGRSQQSCALLLAEGGYRRLTAAIVTHSDEDHIGGMTRVIETSDVDTLFFPEWMRSDPAAVPLIRIARRKGTRVMPLARGSWLNLNDTTIAVLWPPYGLNTSNKNNRSIVARIETRDGSVLTTADANRSIMNKVMKISNLEVDILVVPHHGSRDSTSPALIEATQPRIALIPAGPFNPHGHPHTEVLQRFRLKKIPIRYPARDGWCGAVYQDGNWHSYP